MQLQKTDFLLLENVVGVWGGFLVVFLFLFFFLNNDFHPTPLNLLLLSWSVPSLTACNLNTS